MDICDWECNEAPITKWKTVSDLFHSLNVCKSMVLDGIHPRNGKSWWRNLPSHFSASLSAGYYTWVTTPCSGVGLGESGWKFACWKRTRGCWLAAGWTVSSVPRWPRKPNGILAFIRPRKWLSVCTQLLLLVTKFSYWLKTFGPC